MTGIYNGKLIYFKKFTIKELMTDNFSIKKNESFILFLTRNKIDS